MKPEDQIKALAELDGWTIVETKTGCVEWFKELVGRAFGSKENEDKVRALAHVPDYLTSYDAIIPLIQKVSDEMRQAIAGTVLKDGRISFMSTPAQLCEALLRATGKWVDSDEEAVSSGNMMDM